MKLGPHARMSARGSFRRPADAGEASTLAMPSELSTTFGQRILAILLALVLAVSMVPSNALASDDNEAAANNDATELLSSTDENTDAGSSSASVTASSVDESTDYLPDDVSDSDAASLEIESSSELFSTRNSQSDDAVDSSISTNISTETDSLQVPTLDEIEKVKTTFEIIGIDADGNPQTWVCPMDVELSKGATAADAFLQVLSKSGLVADYDPDTAYGFYLKSIISPATGKDLGYDRDTGKYWQFFVNGASSDLGMSGVVLDGTQTLTLAYTTWNEEPNHDDQISASVSIIGPDANGGQYSWASQVDLTLKKGQKVSDAIDALIASAGLHATIYGTGEKWYLDSINAPYDDSKSFGWDSSTNKYWQLFMNGTAAEYGAGAIDLAQGDNIQLVYSAWGDAAPGWVTTTVDIIGADSNGNPIRWADTRSLTLPEGSTVADLTAAYFENSDLVGWYTDNGSYWSLDYISEPYGNHEMIGTSQDADGDWTYWALYVNGVYSDDAANKCVLENGAKIVWAYTMYGSAQPNPDEFVIDPGAERPDYSADWSGFGNGGGSALVNVPTPGEAADLKWSVSLKSCSDPWVSVGDPIIVNGELFVTSNSELIKVDSTGTVVKRVNKGGTTSYFSRPVYADGLIICASDDGTLAAFTADTLTCVWKTKALASPLTGGKYQANSTMTVLNGCVYAEFEAGAGSSGTASAGAMVCVDIATGAVVWQNATVKGEDDFGAGYYWSGACVSGNDLIIGDESGSVKLIDSKTGAVKSSASLQSSDGSLMPCRATIVSAGEENGKSVYLAVGRQPATLFKVVRDGDTLSIVGSVEFGNTSTSTPAVAGGKAFVGGNDAAYIGQLAVIDIASMTVDDVVKTEKYAEVKASPLASVQGDDTYVYFTANKTPGALYRYSVSDGSVVSIYTPSGSDANYCTASVIADSEGNLYYSNDSGSIFALSGVEGCRVSFKVGAGNVDFTAMPAKGKKMVEPDNPTREGYTFGGWFVDYECTTAWDFNNPVTADMTLYAKWDKNPEPKPSDDDNGNNSGSDNNGGGTNNGGANGGSNGSNGGSSASTGAPAASNAPVSTSVLQQTSGAADNAAADDANDAKAESSDKATSRSAAKLDSKNGSSNDVATTSASPDDAVDNGAPVWAYVVLAVGIAAAVAAIAWFVAARRRNSTGK